MKKLAYFSTVSLFFLLLITSCSKESNEDINDKEYSFKTAKKNGDVIQMKDKIYNVKKMNSFIDKYNSNKGGSVRLTKYNEKSEPVIIDLMVNLDSDPHRVHYDIDYSYSKIKGNNGEMLSNTQCKSIKKVEDSSYINYSLYGCNEIHDTVLLFKYPK
ncbi:DUF4362 domain-containing protein [Bacillus sp. AL-1R]